MLKPVRPTNKRKVEPVEIVPVGNDDIGYFYLAKLGYVKAGERNELTEVDVMRQQSTFVLDNLVNVIASDRKVAREEAYELVFGEKDPIPMSELNKFYPDEVKEFLEKSRNLKAKIAVATLILKGYYTSVGRGLKFIPGRSAHPITIVSNAKVGQTTIEVSNISKSMTAGESIKFDKEIITLSDHLVLSVDSPEIRTISVSPLSVDLLENEIGFLFSLTEKTYILGDESWGESDTCNLDADMLDLIYDFYDKESTGWTIPETAEEETEEVTSPLAIEPEEPHPTGEISITESKSLELPTIA
jgi:hypothetical protein